MIDVRLKEWATPRQAQYIDAVNEHGSLRAAARALGIKHQPLIRAIKAIERRAVMQGYAPDHDMTKVAPAPFVVKGTSTLYDAAGAQKLQWVKTKLDGALAEQAIRDFVEYLTSEAKGLSPIVARPKCKAAGDLLAVYPMGDPHFGMYAWAEEAGDNFDLDTAESLTKAAIDRLVDSAPYTETAVIIELGDFFHADNNSASTPKNKNALDVDTRWSRVMQVGLRSMVHTILRALERHKHVVVRIVKGNHDEHSSFALALALDAYFSNNKRVTIDLSPAAFWYYRHGKVLLGATHGDTIKMGDLPGVMACDRAEDWGQTTHRYWYQGHIHHEDRKEFPGVTVEAFRTLAARDAWHAGQGYRAGRDMNLIVHHKDFGEIERHRCDIAMLKEKTK